MSRATRTKGKQADVTRLCPDTWAVTDRETSEIYIVLRSRVQDWRTDDVKYYFTTKGHIECAHEDKDLDLYDMHLFSTNVTLHWAADLVREQEGE